MAGAIVHTLTSPTIMSSYLFGTDWKPRSVLTHIATAVDENGKPRYHALIDTGALVTGMSNEEVARYLVSEAGFLVGTEGVAFLDEADRKMVYVRSTGNILRLEESAVSRESQFTFYDQIHTTGMLRPTRKPFDTTPSLITLHAHPAASYPRSPLLTPAALGRVRRRNGY
jgi:hypothetical protein